METGSLNLTAVIIQELSENEDLKKIIYNIAGNDPYLKLELYQEVFHKLCTRNPEIIESKFRKDELIGYTISLAQKEFKRTRTSFNKNIKIPLQYTDLDSIDDIIFTDDIDEYSENLEDLKEEINRMSCCPRTNEEAVQSTILNIYLKNNCNVTKTAKELRISKDYVRIRLTEIKIKLEEELLKKSKNRNL